MISFVDQKPIKPPYIELKSVNEFASKEAYNQFKAEEKPGQNAVSMNMIEELSGTTVGALLAHSLDKSKVKWDNALNEDLTDLFKQQNEKNIQLVVAKKAAH